MHRPRILAILLRVPPEPAASAPRVATCAKANVTTQAVCLEAKAVHAPLRTALLVSVAKGQAWQRAPPRHPPPVHSLTDNIWAPEPVVVNRPVPKEIPGRAAPSPDAKTRPPLGAQTPVAHSAAQDLHVTTRSAAPKTAHAASGVMALACLQQMKRFAAMLEAISRALVRAALPDNAVAASAPAVSQAENAQYLAGQIAALWVGPAMVMRTRAAMRAAATPVHAV